MFVRHDIIQAVIVRHGIERGAKIAYEENSARFDKWRKRACYGIDRFKMMVRQVALLTLVSPLLVFWGKMLNPYHYDIICLPVELIRNVIWVYTDRLHPFLGKSQFFGSSVECIHRSLAYIYANNLFHMRSNKYSNSALTIFY